VDHQVKNLATIRTEHVEPVEAMLARRQSRCKYIFTSATVGNERRWRYIDAADKYMSWHSKHNAMPRYAGNAGQDRTNTVHQTSQHHKQAATSEQRYASEYAAKPAYTAEAETKRNELLEHQHGDTLEFRTTGQTVSANIRTWKPWEQSSGHVREQSQGITQHLDGRAFGHDARVVQVGEQ
jgi:hypothetical protein